MLIKIMKCQTHWGLNLIGHDFKLFSPNIKDHYNIQTLPGFENEFNFSNSVFRTTVIKDDTRNENYRQSHRNIGAKLQNKIAADKSNRQ